MYGLAPDKVDDFLSFRESQDYSVYARYHPDLVGWSALTRLLNAKQVQEVLIRFTGWRFRVPNAAEQEDHFQRAQAYFDVRQRRAPGWAARIDARSVRTDLRMCPCPRTPAGWERPLWLSVWLASLGNPGLAQVCRILDERTVGNILKQMTGFSVKIPMAIQIEYHRKSCRFYFLHVRRRTPYRVLEKQTGVAVEDIKSRVRTVRRLLRGGSVDTRQGWRRHPALIEAESKDSAVV